MAVTEYRSVGAARVARNRPSAAVADTAATPGSAVATARLVSLDVFRGLTVAAMVIVNNPGDGANVYWPLDHAKWNGWTPTDLIFPFFLFIVGVSIGLGTRQTTVATILRRGAIIWGLGVFLAAFPFFELSTVRITGVLARIAWCYVPTALLAGGFVAWTVVVAVDNNDKDVFPPVLPAALGTAMLALAAVYVFMGRLGRAFSVTALATIAVVATLFTSLYPRVMVSNPDFGNSLTVDGAASSEYSLQVISIAALIFVPLVLLYQGWSYHVFRRRIGSERVEPGTEPTSGPSIPTGGPAD